MHLNRKHRILALKLLRMVILGEFHLNVLLLAYLHAHHLLFKAGNKGVRAYHQRLVLRRSAGELHSVHTSGIVKGYGVALLNGTALHLYHTACTVKCGIQFALHILIGYSILIFLDFYTLVFAKLHLGLQINRCSKHHALVVLDLFDVYLRTAHRYKLQLIQRLAVSRAANLIESVLEEYALAVILLNKLAGSLALAEAGYGIPSCRLVISLLNCLFEFLTAYRNGNDSLILFVLLKRTHISFLQKVIEIVFTKWSI